MKYEDLSYYHVYNRGAHKEEIFHSAFHYEYFLKLLNQYREKYRVRILAYCLLPNHFHLLLKQEEQGSISRFLQTTCNAYVQSYNKMEHHSGTIFQGAAKSKFIEHDEYAVQLALYIHSNPVASGYVQKPENWEFSDYCEWIDVKPFTFDGKYLRDMYFGRMNEYQDMMRTYLEQKDHSNLFKVSKPYAQEP